MNKKLVLSALSALAVAIAAASPALAATPADHPCLQDLQAVQAAWDSMAPMGMSNASDEGGSGAADALRIARDECKAGNVAATQTYLNVVRSHLAMAQHPAPHDR